MDARGCVSVAPELLIFLCPCRRDRCAHRVAPPSIRPRGVAARVCSLTRADLDTDPNDVRRVFDAVARHYDITNDILSIWLDCSLENNPVEKQIFSTCIFRRMRYQ